MNTAEMTAEITRIENRMIGAFEIGITSFEAWKAFIEFRKEQEAKIAEIKKAMEA
jgi:hypothetical protein